MRIVVEGNLSLAGSYGIVNHHIAEELALRGHDVSMVGFDVTDRELTQLVATRANSRVEVGEPDGPVDVRIRQMWPPVWGHRGAERLVIIQPWEFGSIPLSWIAGVRDADAIWVPSQYCKRGYLQAGVEASKVWVVPNGVDTEVPQHEVRQSRDVTRLLFLGGTIMRKGVDVLIAALDRLDDATLARTQLTIKEVGADTFYQNQSLLAQSLAQHQRVASRVSVEARYLSRADLLHLITESDVLVHPYRSEGFGLGVLEAMAVGTPVIHTRGGATNEFCGANESLLIPATFAVGESPRVGDSILADRSYWYEPSVDELGRILKEVVDGEVDLTALARAARERASSLGWNHVGDLVHETLASLVSGREPTDELSRLTTDLASSLQDSPGETATLLSRLVAVGDVASALDLATQVESRIGVRERGELSAVRERLSQITESVPDVWSAGPYRSQIASAQYERAGYFAYAHDFEGGDHATYDIATRLAGYLGACDSILDIACGQGSMLRVCRALGKRVQGIEADPALVQALRADGFTVYEGFIPNDLASIEPEPFDGVFIGHIVEHLHPSEFQTLLEWIFDHVADHGVVMIQTPDFSAPGVGLENFWLDSTHIRPYPVRLLKAMLSKSGFVPVEGACGPVRDIAPLDVIAVGRRIARPRTLPAPRRPTSLAPVVGHLALLSGTSGFAHASRTLFDVDYLAQRGVDVLRVDVSTSPDLDTPGDALPWRTLRDANLDVAVVDVPVGWLSTVSTSVRAKYRVARTTFEATPLPYDFRMALRAFDEVWCFSSYDAQILVDSGISATKVYTVAPGTSVVDVEAVLDARLRVPRGRFAFLSVFHFEPRKNPEALLRAFAAVAAHEPACDLTLKLSGVTPADFETWLHAALSPTQLALVQGRLKVFTEHVSRETLTQLYLESDAFVLASRGEGYGLPFLEALAHGLATICPDVGGHRDFCTEQNSILLATSPSPARVVAGSGVFSESLWRDVHEDDLVRAMLRAVNDRDLLNRLGSQGVRDVAPLSVEAYQHTSQHRLLEVMARIGASFNEA